MPDFTSISTTIANGLFLGFVAGIPLIGFFRKVRVYETFIEGAKDGFDIAIKIIPYLVAMLVAIGMFRASGAMDCLANLFSPLLSWLHIPPEVFSLGVIRPFSGSASNGILAEIIHTYGPDSFAAQVASTIMGSTETTFYVLAVYFGAVGIKRTRHAIPAGLFADFVGVVASILVCRWLFL
jgi:spore maturation protein B